MKKLNLKQNHWGVLFVLPGLIGFILFYLVPVLLIGIYSFTDVGHNFVFFENYISVLKSETFLLAMKNTLIYLLACGGITMLFSFLIAWVIYNFNRKKIAGASALKVSFLFPMIIPTGIIVLFTEILFLPEGVINNLINSNINWLSTSPYSFWILVLLYVWKNFGYFVIIFFSAFERIRYDNYEAARVDGAGNFKILTKITLPQIKSALFFIFIMSIIGVFKMNRESYLLYGDYPSDSAYMLQNFINNNLAKLNLNRVSSAAMIIFIVFSLIIAYMIRVSERSDD